MENTEKYRIVDNEGNEVLADVSVSLLEFIEEVKQNLNSNLHLFFLNMQIKY